MAFKTKYPWNDWLTRDRSYRLVQGRHFTCAMHGMAQQIRNAAKKRSVRVSILFEASALVVTVLPSPQEKLRA